MMPDSRIPNCSHFNTKRQVEILGQMFGPDSMAQMAANEELLQKMVNDKVTLFACLLCPFHNLVYIKQFYCPPYLGRADAMLKVFCGV